ncbi:MAG: DUF2110 family protein [Promethearchaeota archaeon]
MNLTLLARAYGAYRNKILQTTRARISDMIAELDAELTEIRVDRKDHITVTIEGEDSEFVSNVLIRDYGKIPRLSDLEPGSRHGGYLIDVGKVGYGLYVDIGITNPNQMDALIPLHKLREQTSLKKRSLRGIAKQLVLIDNLPVDIEILSVDFTGQRIESCFHSSTINRIESWTMDDHERLIILGSTEEMIEGVLKKSGHREDIYRIEKIGFFEYSLRCKRSTRASGILAAIGPRLRGVQMHLFIPKEVEAK